jgi:hypothetical protein
MAPGPRDMALALLALPAELRVKIYEKNIHSVPVADPPTHAPLAFQQIFVDKRVAASWDLSTYRGLILSNKQVYEEFEHEWCKAFNTWLAANFLFPRLIFTAVTRISDSVHVRIGFHDQIQGWLHNVTDYHPVVALLVDNLPSFGLYPNTLNVHELGPLTEDQIARVKRGRKGRNQSRFLHAMKLLAVAVYQADFYDTEHHLDVGEDYQVVAMNWAWQEVAMKREGLVRWAGVDWRDRVFYGS